MKDVVGYEGLYSITKDGRVWSETRGMWRSIYKNNGGYKCVVLCKQGKYKGFLVHRLIAKAFIPNPQKLPHINHKNGVKLDNSITNLEWVTPAQNMQHARENLGFWPPNGEKSGASKLQNEHIRIIRQLHEDGLSLSQIGKRFDTCNQNVWHIVKRKTWKHI
jgi:hypothetical protein